MADLRPYVAPATARPTAEDYADLPDAMREARRWLVWRRVPKPGKKPRKVPYYADGAKRGPTGTPEDTARLATFAAALTALQSGAYAGLGFALGPDGTGNYWQGVDLDDVAEHPGLPELADDLPGYTEASPSGNGVHAVGYGRRFDALGSNGSGIEAYCEGRYFTVTGEQAGIHPPTCLAAYVEQTLQPMHQRAEPDRQQGAGVQVVPAETVTDLRSALNSMRSDDRKLWVRMGYALATLGDVGRGLWLDWSSTSDKYDLADAAEVWDTCLPDRTSYQAVFAEAQARGWINPRSKAARVPEPPGNDTDDSQADPFAWPPPLDLIALSRTEPQPPRAIIADWLPCGYATLLAAHGGAGKSSIALHMAVCMALGRPFFGLPVERRRVRYLSCEDRADALHWRLSRICRHEGVDMAGLSGHLQVVDLVGYDALLWMSGYQHTGPTAAHARLRVAMGDTEVLVVDGVADTFGGNENSRADIKQYVNSLVALIPPATGAVLLIHHVDKASANGTAVEGYSGSTGWHNSARARWYLYPETTTGDEGTERTGRLLLDLRKSNLGMAGQSMALQWDDEAHLFVGRTVASVGAMERHLRDETEREGIIAAIREIEASGDYVPAAAQGPRTAHHVLSATESLPESLKNKPGRRRFWRHIEHLRRIGAVRESSMRRANRHVVVTLTLQAADGAGCADASHSSNSNTAHSDAGAHCADASHSAGGYRGGAHTQCLHCAGEGCAWCER